MRPFLFWFLVFGNTLTMPPLALAETPQIDHTVISYYVGLMNRKIRMSTNPSFCQTPNAEIMIDMTLTHNGDMSETPKLVQSSGDTGCDDEILRAILKAKPFALPHDHPAELKLMLEPLHLKFRPRG